jgi:hypothetical protein
MTFHIWFTWSVNCEEAAMMPNLQNDDRVWREKRVCKEIESRAFAVTEMTAEGNQAACSMEGR